MRTSKRILLRWSATSTGRSAGDCAVARSASILAQALAKLPGRVPDAIALFRTVLVARCLTSHAQLQSIDPVRNELAVGSVLDHLGDYQARLGQWDEALAMHQAVRQSVMHPSSYAADSC